MRIRLQQAARRARQVGAIEPRIAGHAGHEQDQVGLEFAALGDDLAGLESLQLVPEMRTDVAPRHFAQQAPDRLRSEPVAGLGGGTEEHQLEAVAAALAAQLLVDAEQELEHRTAAHRAGFVRIAGKAHGDGATLQRLQTVANLFGGGDPLARRDGVLDARQLLQEPPARRDDQAVVGDVAQSCLDDAAALAQTGDLGAAKRHAHAPQEVVQRHHQVGALAHPARNPDDPRQVVQFGTRRDQRDVDLRVALADCADGRQAGEAGADDGDARHRVSSLACSHSGSVAGRVTISAADGRAGRRNARRKFAVHREALDELRAQAHRIVHSRHAGSGKWSG